MKNTIKILAIALIFSSSAVYAQSSIEDQKSVKTLLSKNRLSDVENTQVFNGLARLVDNKISVSTKDLIEMILAYSERENSDAPYDLLYELKKGNPDEFNKALKQISPEKRKRALEIIDMSASEEKYGNG